MSKLTREERTKILVDAHNRYVAWWLPIDVANGSVLAPMCLSRFCEFLLTLNDNNFWNKWMEPNDYMMKRYVLDLLKQHWSGEININKLET